MSADNWAICPQCKARKEKIDEQVKNSYGVIPAEEYLELSERSKQKLDYTLREDYEIGIYDGSFIVRYSGRCTVCGFSYEFNQSDTIRLTN